MTTSSHSWKFARLCALCTAAVALVLPAWAQYTPPTSWRPFSPDSPWNRPIPTNAPIDPNSSLYMHDILTGGSAPVLIPHEDIPVYYVDAATPRIKIPIVWANHSTLGGPGYNSGVSVPFPTGAQPASNSDHKMVIVDYANRVSWEFWGLKQNTTTGNWTTLSGTTFDLNSDGAYYGVVVPSAQEAGNPLIGGLIRYDELNSGQINHALMMCYDFPSKTAFRYPACRAGGDSTHKYAVPMGALLQLDPTLDLNDPALQLSTTEKIVARALQQYGAYMVSNGNCKGLYFQDLSQIGNITWDGMLPSGTLSHIPVNRMRVVDSSYLLPQDLSSTTGGLQPGSGTSTALPSSTTLSLATPYPLSNQTVTTNSQGQFAFTSVLNGAYTITPEAVGYDFSPPSQSVVVQANDLSGISFTATPNGQQAQYLYAGGLTIFRSLTSKTLAVTYNCDESGTVMNPNNAMGFGPNFDGYFTFTLQNGISPTRVKQLRFETNFWGSNPWQSLWKWQIYNWKNQTWQPVMDSSTATSNTWTYIKADMTNIDLTPYFSPSGSLHLRYSTSSNNYSSALDYLMLRVIYL